MIRKILEAFVRVKTIRSNKRWLLSNRKQKC